MFRIQSSRLYKLHTHGCFTHMRYKAFICACAKHNEPDHVACICMHACACTMCSEKLQNHEHLVFNMHERTHKGMYSCSLLQALPSHHSSHGTRPLAIASFSSWHKTACHRIILLTEALDYTTLREPQIFAIDSFLKIHAFTYTCIYTQLGRTRL